MTTPTAPPRPRNARYQAEQAVAALHSAEVHDIEKMIEAGGDVREIVQARRQGNLQAGGADQAAVDRLARLRAMAMERINREGGGEPWSGPLLIPRGVDFDTENITLHYWAAVLLGIVLAQNAIDGDSAALGRPIPVRFSLWEAEWNDFWHGDPDDDGNEPDPIGDWPAVFTDGEATPRAGAA
jgi:hypothetical protein